MATSIRLRPWQRLALDHLRSSPEPDFLAVATPGAGKTTFALTAVAQSLTHGLTSSVIVVAPTQHLKLQWATAAHRLGLHLDHEWTAKDGSLPPDMHGIVTTYQQVSTSAAALAQAAAGAFVVFDEIHHAADDRTWGESLVTAFSGAARRLSLSGTPFRSDTSAIPFVEYHLEEARPHFEYGYSEALVDGRVVRPVFFPRIGGQMEWIAPDGSELSASFEDPLETARANQRLRVALSMEGEWLRAVLTDAHTQLTALRRVHADAGGLVIAMDQEHAQAVAGFMRERFRVEVTVAVSDDPGASDKISAFAAGSDPWIVAVRMVSEGVDIPRLRVGVFATNTTTELFFRQAVGRLVRWTPGLRSQKAFLYIPDDSRLRRWAAGIGEERRHSLAKRSRDEDEEEWRDPAALDDVADFVDADEQLSLFAVVSATVDTDATELPPVFADDDDDWDTPSDTHGYEIQLAVPPPAGSTIGEPADGAATGPTRRQRKTELRAANANAVSELSRVTGSDHRTINGELNRLSDITRINDATVEELAARLELANRWLRKL